MAFGSWRSRSPLPDKIVPSPSVDSGTLPQQRSTSRSGRHGSFSFLSRSKSTERIKPSDNDSAKPVRPNTVTPKRSFSNSNRLVKKQVQRELDEVLKQAQEDIPAVPPVIPTLTSQPQLQTFGGDNAQAAAAAAATTTTGGRSSTSSRTTVAAASQARNRPGGKPVSPTSIEMNRSLYNVPVPPVPEDIHSKNELSEQQESMTNRGRHSYASSFASVNSPRRVRRRKDPTPFNILVLGTSNSGKTSLIEFLRTSCTLPAKKQRPMTRGDSVIDHGPPKQTSTSSAFKHRYVETELGDNERIGLTLWDSEGLESNIVDLQLREITTFIESKFEETFSEETKVVRSPNARDSHIHCVFLVLDPMNLEMSITKAKKAMIRNVIAANDKSARAKGYDGILESKILDEDSALQVLRTLQGKTTVIPVISKADTVTSSRMRVLKRAVWSVIKDNGLDPLEALGIEMDDDADDDSLSSASMDDDPLSRQHKPSTDSFLQIPGSAGSRSRKQDVSPDRYQHSVLDTSSNSSGSETALAGTSTRNDPSKVSTDLPDAHPPLPLSIITPEPPNVHHNESEKMPGNIGRGFAWGFADPYDEKHCDFVRLKEVVMNEWRSELREKSRELWYENWRTARLRGDDGDRLGAAKSLQVPKLASRSGMNASRSSPAIGPSSSRSVSRRTPSPMISHPVRNESPAVMNRPQYYLHPGSQGSGADYGASAGAHNSSYSNQGPADGGGDWARSLSNRMAPVDSTPSRGSDYVTALPSVGAEEVGVAK